MWKKVDGMICLVWLAATTVLGHGVNGSPQFSVKIPRSIASEPEVSVPPSPPTPAFTPPSFNAANSGAPRTLTKTVLFTSDIVLTSYVVSISNPYGSTIPSVPDTAVQAPSSSSHLDSRSQSASASPSSSPVQISITHTSTDRYSSSTPFLSATSSLLSTESPSQRTSSPSTSSTSARTTLAASSSHPSSSGSNPKASEIPHAPSAAGASGSSWGASRGTEKVWWVAFLVPVVFTAS